MKKIAVLTDFSIRAENAAIYALHLAQYLNANIVLYNSFVIPSAEPLASQVAWPMEDYEELKDENERCMELFILKLKKELSGFSDSDFKPMITGKCHFGHLTAYLDEFVADNQIVMLAMASHQKGFSAMMLGNHLTEIIENTALPVLVIPEDRQFNKLNKIAFATDFSKSDLEVLNAVKDLAMPFHGEVMLAHICEDPSSQEAKYNVDFFLTQVSNKINYPNIYYRNVADKHIKNGLEWLVDNVAFDLLVMVHRNKGFFTKLFNNSNTETMAAAMHLPLLVYPETEAIKATGNFKKQYSSI